jgi:hypothetical protein
VSAWDGSSPTMRTLRLDRDTADRILAGRVAPDDAPPGYADLARLVAAVSAPPAPRELSRLDEDVEAAAATRSPGPAPASALRGPSRRRTRLARVRTVTLVVAGTVIATSGLAAAGVLPDPVQDVVSDVLSRVGITVPAGEDDREGGRDAPVSPVAVVPEALPGDVPRVIPASPRERGHGPMGEHGRPDTPDEAGAGHGSAGPGNSEGAHDEDHGNGPPDETPGNGPPEDPGAGPPSDVPGNGPPADTPGNGPPADAPRNGPPEDTPGNGPPADTPGNGPPADPGGGQGGSPPGHGN